MAHPSVAFPGYPREPMDAIAADLLEMFREAGVTDVELLDIPGGYPAVHAVIPGPEGSPVVTFYAHYDVQPAPEGQGWTTDPWTLTQKDDGRLYGRGAADDKSGVVAHIATLAAFEGKPPVTVRLVVEGEEETGSHIEAYVEAHPEDFRSDVFVVADSGNQRVGAPALTTGLRGDVKALRDPSALTSDLLTELTGSAKTQTREVRAETAALQDALTEAKDAEAARVQAEKEAAEAAAKEAAETARLQAEKEAAAALAAANTVDGAKTTARDMAASRYGWGADQFSCLQSLWTKESGWNYQAYNAGSGATGIPQSLPGSKMATAGADWQTSAATQISWGLDYIKRAYGTPCSAWGHSQATDWY